MAKITHILQKKKGTGILQGIPEFSFKYHDPTRDTLSNWADIRMQFGDYNNDPQSDPVASGITASIQLSTDPSFSTRAENAPGAFINGRQGSIKFPYEWPSGQKYVRAKFTNNLGQVGYSKVLSTYTTGLTLSMTTPPRDTGITSSYLGLPMKWWAINNFRIDYDEPIFVSQQTRDAGPAPLIEWATHGTGRAVNYFDPSLTQWMTFYDPQGVGISSSPRYGTMESPYGALPIGVPVKSVRVIIQQTDGMYFRIPAIYNLSSPDLIKLGDPVKWISGYGVMRFKHATI